MGSIKQELAGGLRWEGMKELTARIAEIMKATGSVEKMRPVGMEIKAVYKKAASVIAEEIRRLAPYDPLREQRFQKGWARHAHIRNAVFVDDGLAWEPNALVGVREAHRRQRTEFTAPHAHLLEFGWYQRNGIFNPGRPSVRPAVTAKKAEASEILKRGFAEIVERHSA